MPNQQCQSTEGEKISRKQTELSNRLYSFPIWNATKELKQETTFVALDRIPYPADFTDITR